MAIDIRTFGKKNPTSTKSDERTKAQFWANVGYVSEAKDSSGEFRFISLALGIPLDNIDDLPTDVRSPETAQMNQAKNAFRDELVQDASKLGPGEEVRFPIGETGLFLQIRRVAEAAVLPANGENPFMRRKA